MNEYRSVMFCATHFKNGIRETPMEAMPHKPIICAPREAQPLGSPHEIGWALMGGP